MSHWVQIVGSDIQFNDNEFEIPQLSTQGGLETINLGEEIGYDQKQDSNQRRMKFSFNHGSIFHGIQLLELIKKGDCF